ncbi:hypothetical protein FQN57_005253 [Myotisia sp. PD_48]|nr:hypothetical protein FQN57_005253 [Myotisia sp. PD_48]
MNCPSRTDQEDLFLHPEWNQNPPSLPADLTKREDLNGRVNARQHRNGSDLSSSLDAASGGPALNAHEITLDIPPPQVGNLADAKFTRYREEFCSARTTHAPSIFYHLGSSIHIVKQWLNRHQSYVWCTVAVALFTYLIYCVKNIANNVWKPATTSQRARRNQACESGLGQDVDYNVPLHVGALFIILFVSSSACAFPILAVKFPRLHIPSGFLFLVRHFGTGVLIATAFVHLLPTAFISLGNPCLSSFWTADYPAMPGAIALAAVFLVTTIEMIFSPAQRMCGSPRDICRSVTVNDAAEDSSEPENDDNAVQTGVDQHPGRPQPDLTRGYSFREHESLCGRSTSFGRRLNRVSVSGRSDVAPDVLETAPERSGNRSKEIVQEKHPESLTHSILSPEQKRQKAVVQCVLLEIGILFHSVFIGMALSVSIGNQFVVLLVAISFHQTFEGLALGSRIAVLSWEPGAIRPWLMALAYGCTTPIGQAIGLATHTLYSPNSEVGLIMVGVMNAISSGLLVYASLVELLSEDFLSDESWQFLRGKRRVGACILVFLGAFGMSLIGAWA